MFITGRPGVGKTSVLIRATDLLKTEGYKIGGMISREVREQGVRVGFEIIDFHTKQKGLLAHVSQPTGPQVSKYRVNMDDLDTIGTNSIVDAVTNADVTVIDEIGGMELLSAEFRKAVGLAIRSSKPVVGAIHSTARDQFINNIRSREDVEVLNVTRENRENLHNTIVCKVIQLFKRS